MTGSSYLSKAGPIGSIVAMTDVKNKHAYAVKEKQLDETIDKNEPLEFGIVVCDVNNLKYINDTYGHEYGDQLISDACSMICSAFKHSPVYRIGGDEFVVVLEGDDYQNREIILQNLNEIVEENNKSDKGVVISCGMAAYEEERGHKFASVFHFADQAMYCRKQELKAANNKNRR